MARIDFSDVPHDDSWKEEKTPMVVMDVVPATSKASGDPMLKVKLKGISGPNASRELTTYFTFAKPQTQSMFKKFYYATTGVELQGLDTDDMSEIASALIGSKVVASIKNEDFNGGKQGKPSGFSAYIEA